MMKLIAWMRKNQDYTDKKQTEQLTRFRHFRHLITRDENFMLNKQKVMQPVLDSTTMDNLKVTRKKRGNWFTNMIRQESCLPTNKDESSSADD